MNKMNLKDRKKELTQELNLAEFHLRQNLSHVSLQNYLPEASSLLPSLATNAIQDSEQLVKRADSLARLVLPESHIIRKLLKYASMFVRGLDIIKS